MILIQTMILVLLLLALLLVIVNSSNTPNPYFTITKTNSTSNPIVFDAKSIRFKRSITDAGNTLVTSTYIKKGEKLITIPCSMCLIAHRTGQIRGLGGQSNKILETCGDLRNSITDDDIAKGRTWDLNLAIALCDATLGEGLGGETEFADEESQVSIPTFWDSYALDLPKPNDITIPFCMSAALLNEIQDNDIKEGALLQQKRLLTLFPSLEVSKAWHRITAMAALDALHSSSDITPLRWAFAMIRSRCFSLLDDWFCVVPIIDMCNHSNQPNARLVVHRNSDSNIDSNSAFNPRDHAVCLYALEDIPADNEITISYGDYDNDRLFKQYGFVMEGNVYDRIKWSQHRNHTNNDTLSVMKIDISMNAIDSVINDNDNYNEINKMRAIAVRESINEGLQTIHSKNMTVIEGLQELYNDLVTIESSYPTTLDDDKNLYDSNSNSNSNSIKNRSQLLMCLKYRIEKKAIITMGKSIIDEAIKILKGH